VKIRPFRIPKYVTFPGLVVRVARAPRASDVLNGDDSSWIYNEPSNAATVYIADDIKELAKQRYCLIHELGHVWWDYSHIAIAHYPDLVKVF
jgi:hypothetical protein